MKVGWVVFGAVTLAFGWWVTLPLPWPWWQILLNPALWAIAVVQMVVAPWAVLFMALGGGSLAYGIYKIIWDARKPKT